MRPAVIRLSKEIIVDSKTITEGLSDLYTSVENNIKYWSSYFGSNWTNINVPGKNQLNAEATQYGEEILRQVLKNKFPQLMNITSFEKDITVNSAETKILGYSRTPDTLIISYTLFTEELTLVDSIGSLMLIARGNHQDGIQNSTIINTLYTVPVENYTISEYSAIKF